MTTEPCDVCDRVECARRSSDDCEAHRVDWRARALQLRAQLAEADRTYAVLLKAYGETQNAVPPERFPIIGGPSVPWSMVAPHEAQAMHNGPGAESAVMRTAESPPPLPAPKYLRTADAARYVRLTRWGLLRARDRGEVAPSGRRGRWLTWEVTELDRFMAGKPIAGGSR